MDTRDTPDWAAELAAAQAWWREAGVDLAFADDATDWLEASRAKAPRDEPKAAERSTKPPGETRPATPRMGGERELWPKSLPEFPNWWLTEPSLDPAPAAQRVMPSGSVNAPLMVLVAMPESGDDAALLAGRQGRLLDAILAAFGFTRDQVYLASVLPRPIAAPDWATLAAAGLGQVLAHHVGLAAPQRLIVFGRDVSSLLGHDPAQVAQSSLRFNHEGSSVPMMLVPALEALLERPALKRGLWTKWLEWSLD